MAWLGSSGLRVHELEVPALGQDQFAWRRNHGYVVLAPGFVLVHVGLDSELELVSGGRRRTMHARMKTVATIVSNCKLSEQRAMSMYLVKVIV